jgi:hypothetical protein
MPRCQAAPSDSTMSRAVEIPELCGSSNDLREAGKDLSDRVRTLPCLGDLLDGQIEALEGVLHELLEGVVLLWVLAVLHQNEFRDGLHQFLRRADRLGGVTLNAVFDPLDVVVERMSIDG